MLLGRKRFCMALTLLCLHGISVAEEVVEGKQEDKQAGRLEDRAEDGLDDRWISFTWENDFIADDDSGYTNGMGVSWGYGPFSDMADSDLPAWLQNMAIHLPGVNAPQKQHAVSYRIAQAMFTPEDIEAEELIEDDRPYAGLLLWHANLHSYDEQISDRYWLTLGVVGPASGAEEVQKFIHGVIGVNAPNGWDNQLENEVVFAASAERLWRLKTGVLGKNLEYDWVGISAGDLGTLRSEVGGGLGFRLGQGLNRSFAAASVIPGRNINPLSGSLKNEWHLFANLYGRYVFNDITIDGNTFEDSHSVTLKHEQLFFAIGGAYHSSDWGVVVSVQDGSQTFEEKKENSLFGSLSVTFRY